jgi:indole-3-glycerol phosphate synthase
MPQKTPDILKKIVARKHEEIAESISRVPMERMIELTKFADSTRGFYSALKEKVNNRQSGIIAEIKKASPSKGILRENFEPV